MTTFSRQATLEWEGGLMDGAGLVTAGTQAFSAPATFPSAAGDPPGKTTPEEMLAAAHAICFGIGLRSVIGRSGGRARRVSATATIAADKGPAGIVIRSAHLDATIEGLEGIAADQLRPLVRVVEEGCTISVALRGNVAITAVARAVP